MDLCEAKFVSLHGEVAPGWEKVRDHLVKHFPKLEALGGGMCVHHAGQVVVDVWMGQSSTNADWHPDKPVDMGSAVVGIGTLCVLFLRRQGQLDLNDYVTKHWPEFAHDDVKVNQLLSGDAKITCGTTWWCISELVRHVDPDHRTIDTFVSEELLPSLNLEKQPALTIPEPSSPFAPVHWAGATARSLAAIYYAFMEIASINTDMPRKCAVIGNGSTHAVFDVETEVAYAFLTNSSSHTNPDVAAQQWLVLRDIVSEIAKELHSTENHEEIFGDAESSAQEHGVGRVMSRTSTSIQTLIQSEDSLSSTVTKLLTPKEPSPTCPFCIELGGFCGRCSQWRQTLLDDVVHEPEVLRGVPASTVMWQMGYWIRSGSKPSDEEGQKMHKLSFPVETITRFLSHSWHANANIKVMALMCFYNGESASIIALVCALLVSVLQQIGVIPCMGPVEFPTWELDVQQYSVPWKDTRGCWCMMTYIIIYYIVFFFGSRMRDRVATAYPDWPHNKIKTAFLDKLCIHQTDPIKKQKGINAIGAFLIKSERVTILWDKTYFTRLWCVFEVAVFRRLNPGAIIEFIPITLGNLEFYGHLAICMACMVLNYDLVVEPQRPMFFLLTHAYVNSRERDEYDIARNAVVQEEQYTAWESFMFWLSMNFWYCMLPMYIFYQWRVHVKSLLDVPRILANFSAQKANCFSETDRKFVESVIVALYDSLENFDEHVRGSMAAKLNKTVGTDSTPMLSMSLIYRFVCIPIFVCIGLDHGLFWDLLTLPSLMITLLLTFPGLICFVSRIFSLLPNMSWKVELWVMIGTMWAYWIKFDIPWRMCLFQGMRWGTTKTPHTRDDLAFHLPIDLATFLVYGLAFIMDRYWSATPMTDKGLGDDKVQEECSKRRPSLYS